MTREARVDQLREKRVHRWPGFVRGRWAPTISSIHPRDLTAAAGDGLTYTPVYCSWSGGKDSAMALHRAVRLGAEPRLLVTMMTEGGERSRSHGLHRDVLSAQAEALGLPVVFAAASWDDYEETLRTTLAEAPERGIRTGVFGDIDTPAHREWVERVAAEAGTRPILPLWGSDRSKLVHELLDLGFRAVLVAVRDGVLPPSMLGAEIDRAMLDRFEDAGIDLAGENGEFHTCVVDGPLFRRPIELEAGETSLRDGVWFIDLQTPS